MPNTTKQKQLGAWHGDAALKERIITALKKDREADAYIQGTYLEEYGSDLGYRGCAVGCIAQAVRGFQPHVARHQAVAEDLAIPTSITHLTEAIFEGLPTEDGLHARFAVASYEAIPVGADLDLVASYFLLDLLADPDHGVLQFAAEDSMQRAAIESVIRLCRRRLGGDEPASEEWAAAAWVAGTVAKTAWAAVWTAVAAHDEWMAVKAVWAADAVWAAEPAHYEWMAARLIHHLSNAPAVVERLHE